FVKDNRARLDELQTGFFTVCLAAADDTPESREETAGLEAAFFETTGWAPDHHAVFAGCLAWSQYDFFTRTIMRLIVRNKPNADLDRSHDHDYTDYDAVAQFALQVVPSTVE